MTVSDNRDLLELGDGSSVTVRLRLYFLAPLALLLAVVIGLFVFAFHSDQQKHVVRAVGRMQASASDVYRNSIRRNAVALQTIIGMLEKDKLLHAALARGDRAALLEESGPLFTDLQKSFGVTHLYFTRPDRVNLLRVHQPELHGDVIERFTTREAQRTGAQAQGLELGPLGTFTLRLVAPWHADAQKKELIGFVELGVELVQALQDVRDDLGVQSFLLIRKQLLQREPWESGMKALGRTPDWDRFPDVVLSAQEPPTMPDLLAEKIGSGKMIDSDPALVFGRASYHAIALALRDAAGVDVGRLVFLVNMSREADRARRAVLASGLVALLVGGALLGFFYWLVGRIGAQFEKQRHLLTELAMRDGLTQLFNHRTFYALLEKEVARTQRYEIPLSVLMLDIDRFKHVNDSYGHVAGDRILAELGQVISQQVRQLDSVCRYGGEEITVILPETGAEEAMQMAERIRCAIEQHRFDIGHGRNTGITVSLGVASLAAQQTTAEKLVAMADQALYAAKEGGRNRVCRGS